METPSRSQRGNFASTTESQGSWNRQNLAASANENPQAGLFNRPIPSPARTENSGNNGFHPIGEDNIRLVRGWPSAAAEQSSGYNHSHHRSFDVTWHRVLLDQQTKIESLEKELENKDIEDERDPDRRWRLERTVFDIDSLFDFPYGRGQQDSNEDSQHAEVPRQPEGSHDLGATYNYGRNKQDDKDQILEALFSRLLRYALVLLNKISGLHQTSPIEQQNMIEALRKKSPVNEDSWKFLKMSGDFISTRSDRAHEPFESLIYDGGLISRIFQWAMKDRDHPQIEGDGSTYLNTDRIEAFGRALVGLVCGFSLVAPIAILLLAPLSKGLSLAVVCLFGGFLVLVLTLRGMKMDTVMLAFSAYMAVLVAFLANQPQNQC